MVEDKNIYWNIYATLMISTFGVMHTIAMTKRWIEKMKDYQNHQHPNKPRTSSWTTGRSTSHNPTTIQ